ncbi:MAG: DUF1232 domain-containing protein [Chloroflexi bacterium]|nr:DUF1232 domain-containing protein [Chloroflexota bacterium]
MRARAPARLATLTSGVAAPGGAILGGEIAGMASKSSEKSKQAATKRGKRGGGAGMRRVIAAAAFMPMASRAPLYARLLWSLATDARTPTARKVMLAGALGYVVIGRDIVPDFVPVLGQLDDLVVVALATEFFLDGLDDLLLAEKLAEAGIPRAAYDEDVARVRRLVPGPIRRAVRRIPGAVRFVADAVGQTGVQPRLRGWINREGAPA